MSFEGDAEEMPPENAGYCRRGRRSSGYEPECRN